MEVATYPVSQSNKRRREFYEDTTPLIVPQPKVLVLRYEDASEVITAYVKWKYNLAEALQGYTKATLLSAQLYNNYSTARLSSLGIKIDEFPRGVRAGASTNNAGPTWVVPNSTYTTTAFTVVTYLNNQFWPPIFIDNLSTNNLTVSLYDGAGLPLVASGVPAGFFCDLTILLS
jgi:hypothetical protein